jgi:hypothetical protein
MQEILSTQKGRPDIFLDHLSHCDIYNVSMAFNWERKKNDCIIKACDIWPEHQLKSSTVTQAVLLYTIVKCSIYVMCTVGSDDGLKNFYTRLT